MLYWGFYNFCIIIYYREHYLKDNMEVKNFFKYFCHQKPERTLKVRNHYFPVCARCTGIYLVMFVSLILFWNIQFRSILSIIGVILIVPMGIDGTTQLLGMRESNNKLRFLTGLIGGIGLVILAKSISFFIISFIRP